MSGGAHALIAADGRLIAADELFGQLQRRSGGRSGGPAAMAPVEALVTLARRLRVPVARAVALPCTQPPLSAWVDVQPREGGLVCVTVHGLPARWVGADAAPIADEPEDIPAVAGDWGAAVPPGVDGELRGALERILADANGIGGGGAALAPVYAGYARDIGSAAAHLLDIVGDMEAARALDSPQLRFAMRPFALPPAVEQAIAMVRVAAARREVTIEVDAGTLDPEALALGEERRVCQILVNLLANAVRHSPAGGAIRVHLRQAGFRVFVAVRDHGPGVAPADRARIFDKFVRVAPVTSGGVGLGLYIARRLAEGMGGRLDVGDPPQGPGALFVLALPIPRRTSPDA